MRDCPARDLRNRYIPIEDVESVCGVSVEDVQEMINNNLIRRAEFKKPGSYIRTLHVDPVEINGVIERRKKRRSRSNE